MVQTVDGSPSTTRARRVGVLVAVARRRVEGGDRLDGEHLARSARPCRTVSGTGWCRWRPRAGRSVAQTEQQLAAGQGEADGQHQRGRGPGQHGSPAPAARARLLVVRRRASTPGPVRGLDRAPPPTRLGRWTAVERLGELGQAAQRAARCAGDLQRAGHDDVEVVRHAGPHLPGGAQVGAVVRGCRPGRCPGRPATARSARRSAIAAAPSASRRGASSALAGSMPRTAASTASPPTLICPWLVRSTCSGCRHRWARPAWCAASSASAISRARSRASAGGSGPSASRSARLVAATHSLTT